MRKKKTERKRYSKDLKREVVAVARALKTGARKSKLDSTAVTLATRRAGD